MERFPAVRGQLATKNPPREPRRTTAQSRKKSSQKPSGDEKKRTRFLWRPVVKPERNSVPPGWLVGCCCCCCGRSGWVSFFLMVQVLQVTMATDCRRPSINRAHLGPPSHRRRRPSSGLYWNQSALHPAELDTSTRFFCLNKEKHTWQRRGNRHQPLRSSSISSRAKNCTSETPPPKKTERNHVSDLATTTTTTTVATTTATTTTGRKSMRGVACADAEGLRLMKSTIRV